MGFYGNVTDTSHIHFQFDKIFPNRLSMDQALQYGTDGIFAGRFVLVKYNPEGDYPFYRFFQGYQNSEASGEAANYLYHDRLFQHPFIYTTFTRVNSPRAENWEQYYALVNDRYIALQNAESFVSNATYYTPSASGESHIVGQNDIIQLKSVITGELLKKFYKCTLSANNGRSGQPAIWEEIISDISYGDYFVNYNIDSEAYTDQFDSRGYDATVWQKVYSEGNGKFVLIAHLNGGYIPSFELFADPPSQSPEAPYIDSKSTDALYRVHVPSHWGLKFKEDDPVEDGGLSEQRVSYEKRTYAQDGSNNYTTEQTTIDAEIYFNKQAADKAIRSNDQDTNNEILLEPTGRSGKTYTNNQQAIDTLELSVHLPFVGNAVSDMYDLMYDYDHTAEAPQMRYTDTNWITGEKPDSVKYNGPQGEKTHNLSTVAGTINTMHDRLGQIIVPLDRWVDPSSANYDSWIAGLGGDKYIYSYQTSPEDPVSYYRLATGETYVEPEANTFQYVPIDFASNEDAYEANTFYYLSSPPNNNANTVLTSSSHASYISQLQVDMSGTYTPRPNRYYYKKCIESMVYTPQTVELYVPHKYFLKQDTSYIRDNGASGSTENQSAPTNPYGQYYYIDETNINANPQPANTNVKWYTFDSGYTKNQFYYRDTNSQNYLLATSDDPDGSIQYCDVAQYPIAQDQIIIYQPGLFYYRLEGNINEYFRIDYSTYRSFQEANPAIISDEGFKLFWLEFDYDNPIVVQTVINGVYQTVVSYRIKAYHELQRAWLKDYPTDSVNTVYNRLVNENLEATGVNRLLYYLDDNNNYIAYNDTVNQITEDGIPYYAIPRSYYGVVLIPRKLYIKGRYYKLEPNDTSTGNYVISWDEWHNQTSTRYYTINEIIPVEYPFYQPNTYWYENPAGSHNYTMDQTAAYQAGYTYKGQYTSGGRKFGQYLVKQRLYVYSDSSGRCPEGYEWNDEAIYVPASITLKKIEKKSSLIEIEGINNGAASINGIILRFQKEYSPESLSRDTTTFRGGLNKLQDLLYTIRKLTPGKVVYVNDFGQLTTGDLSYEQLLNLI